HAMPGDRERCLEADMDDYLAKPIRPQKLLGKLTSWSSRPDTTLKIEEPPASVSGSPASPVLQLGQLHESTDGDPDLARRMLGDFMSEAGMLMRRIRGAVRARRATGVADAAHALKGGSRAIGAAALAGVCQELETVGRERNLAAAREALARAEVELKTLRRAVRAHLGAKGSSRS